MSLACVILMPRFSAIDNPIKIYMHHLSGILMKVDRFWDHSICTIESSLVTYGEMRWAEAPQIPSQ